MSTFGVNIEELNRAFFLSINAPEHASTELLTIATVLADYLVWLIPLIIGIGWLRGGERNRRIMLEATVSGLTSLLINQIIGLIWQHPRPFMIGLGHTYIAHVADSSFPSDHLTLLWAVGFTFRMHATQRTAGHILIALGLPVAWARIYLGVHFPLDMVGAALVGVMSAWLSFREARRFVEPLYCLATRLHRHLFGPLIRRGWFRE